MISLNIPNLPGMQPSKDKWLYKQEDGFRKTKAFGVSRPTTATGSRPATASATTEGFGVTGEQKELIRPASASSFRPGGTAAGLTPMMRASVSRPATAATRSKSTANMPSNIHGVTIGSLGLEEEKVTHKHFAATAKVPGVPNFVERDRVVTRFYGYFDEERPWDNGPLGIPEAERNIVRHLTIRFHVIDQTIEMNEDKQTNSGMVSGAFCSRRRLKKTSDGLPVQLEDLAPGNTLHVLGQRIHITDCDQFTRDYFRRELNIQLAAPVGQPAHASTFVNGAQYATGQLSQTTVAADRLSANRGADTLRVSSSDYQQRKEGLEKTARFLRYDGQILRLQCIELPPLKNGSGGRSGSISTYEGSSYQLSGNDKMFGLLFHLSDSSMEVRLIKGKGGNDKTVEAACIVKRGRVPKNWREVQRGAAPQYYEPMDLQCSNIVDVYGKRLLIVNCNEYTRRLFEDMEVPQTPVRLLARPSSKVAHKVPSQGDGFLNVGSPADTLATVYGTQKQVKDTAKALRNQNRTLRCKLRYVESPDNPRVSDRNRVFMLTYYCEDDTLQIYEEVVRNSGFGGGNFLKRGKYQNHLPEDDRYPSAVPATTGGIANSELGLDSALGTIRDFKATDIYLGNIISVNGHEFLITEMDNLSLRFCESHPDEFPMYSAYAILKRIMPKIISRRIDLRSVVTSSIDVAGRGYVSKMQFIEALEKSKIVGLLNQQEILTLLRRYRFDLNGASKEGDGDKSASNSGKDKDRDSKPEYVYLYHELCDLISHKFCVEHGGAGRCNGNGAAAQLEQLLIVLRRKPNPWRRLLKRESAQCGSIGNYITLASLLTMLATHGINSNNAVGDREKHLLKALYGVPAEQATMILKRAYHRDRSIQETAKLSAAASMTGGPESLELTGKLRTTAAPALDESGGLSMSPIRTGAAAIRNRRQQLLHEVMIARGETIPDDLSAAPSVCSSDFYRADETDERTVINYDELCNDIYVCDWC